MATLLEQKNALELEIKTAFDAHRDTGISNELHEELSAKMDELDKLNAQLAKDAERAELAERIKGIAGSDSPETGGRYAAKSLGDHVVRQLGEVLQKQANGAHLEKSADEWQIKAASDPHKVSELSDDIRDGWLVDRQRSIVNRKREQLVAADLMGAVTVTSPTYKYLVEKPTILAAGAAATVAEGGKKPYLRFDNFDMVTESLAKIAALTKVSDEMIADAPFIKDWIDNQLVYQLSLVEEQQLLKGDGSGSNLKGLLNREGLQQHDVSGAATTDWFDGLYEAIQKVRLATDLQADALLINPMDYIKLRLAKDGNGQYLAGGAFTGQYGNGGIMLNPPVWGLRTVETNAVDSGNFVLGAFRQGAVVLRKGGVRVDAANTNVDDFEHNLVTLRAEERVGLMVPRPMAFVKGTLAA